MSTTLQTLASTLLTATTNGGLLQYGTRGNDTLQGGAGNHVLIGSGGDDYLYDTEGYNMLLGGAGNDAIIGKGSLYGGEGNDDLVAGGNAVDNFYLYAKGDGCDTISLVGDQPSADGSGILVFGEGIRPSSLSLVREENDLIIDVDLADQIRLRSWFTGPEHRLRHIVFEDGLVWKQSEIAGMQVTVRGTDNADVLTGGDENNLFHGGGGNDYLVDVKGDNLFHGGDGDDVMLGTGTFDGGRGDDIIQAWGDPTDNLYFFEKNGGRDTLYAQGEANATAASGTLGFGESLLPERLWLRRDVDDLQINVVGANDGITIRDWYQGEEHQVALFIAGDNRVLENQRVDALVQAMAQHTPPTPGHSDWTAPLPESLRVALAAAWQ